MFSLFLAYNPIIAKDLKRTSTKASLSEWEELVKNIQISCRTNTILQNSEYTTQNERVSICNGCGQEKSARVDYTLWTMHPVVVHTVSLQLNQTLDFKIFSKSSAGMEMVLSHPHKSANAFNWINELVWSQNASQISSVASCGFAEEQIVTDEFHIETV